MIWHFSKAAVWASAAQMALADTLPVHLETRGELTSRLANVHVRFLEPVEGLVTYTFGPCSTKSRRDAQQTIGSSSNGDDASRLVWVMPESSGGGGCISAWDEDDKLVGRSKEQRVNKMKKRRSLERRSNDTIPMNNSTGIDTSGPWFDGVTQLSQKKFGTVNVNEAKSKEVAILGAGMSGLMTYLVLSQAGMTNVTIHEASERLGGRVHTSYLSGGTNSSSYQEMGPMRFPYSLKSPTTNESVRISDHQLVFELAEELNALNQGDKNWTVDFIPWLEHSANSFYYMKGFKLPNGLPPTLAQVKEMQQNGTLPEDPAAPPDQQALTKKLMEYAPGPEQLEEIATNIWSAHKAWQEGGLGGMPGDHWSEFSFMVNYLNGTAESAFSVGNMLHQSWWEDIYAYVYGSAASWKTIDGGINRLPLAFHPHVDNATYLNRKVEKISYSESADKVSLHWRDNYTERAFKNQTFDYAVVSLPMSVLRNFDLPPLNATMTTAIQDVPYTSACKVALEYSERFWEHYENPIYGGCDTKTDIPGLGTVCYPSNGVNSTGPASLLASYVQGELGLRYASVPEDEHVQFVLDAMTEIHGESTRDLYTGNYDRVCWILDPLESGSWAAPTVGQHEAFIPEYFKTQNNLIFVGEHTSYTHAWIAAAIESGIRGGVQMLLELGLVDEAKDVVDKWLAKWIEV